ncbi:hypothetical protein M3P21_10640 [Ruegeria sp. 2012CJ41-6]|uniref:Glyoxalase n=1 Tax=Ruegeria spongiae TaxID=2942209 RepID=A0ABT0Q283_9RHOB|nr:hypothetical protein [Ruegeria spongiae]MCL6283988.1 hypothetical protein [Ruegeria spongiae]
MKYQTPAAPQNEHNRDLSAIGFPHFAVAVDDLDATLAEPKRAGVKMRNKGMDYRGYMMGFVWGPERLTFELAEHGGQGWDAPGTATVIAPHLGNVA